MTREEAIEELSVLWERLKHPDKCEQGCYSFSDGWYTEAIDMAIEALERDIVECWECKFSGRENKDDELLLCTQGWIPKLVLETDYCGKGKRRSDE